MRVYISGPMTGLPDFNAVAFAEAAAHLRAIGHEPVNPHDITREKFGGDVTRPREEYMREDFRALLDCEAIYFLPGWQASVGARAEAEVARAIGLRVLRLSEESALEEAQRLVHGPRQHDYGHPYDDYTRTGKLWGAILGTEPIDPRICALMMAAVKISREVNRPKRDNRVDLAGYAEVADMIAERQETQPVASAATAPGASTAP